MIRVNTKSTCPGEGGAFLGHFIRLTVMDYDTLVRRILFLPKEERKQLAFKIMESITDEEMDHKDRYDMLVSKAEVATYHELAESKDANSTIIRRFVASRLVKDGYSWSEIGMLMGRTHSSIIALVKGMKNILSVPAAYEKEIIQYKLFNDLVDEFDNG